jgi:hypothetical protein
MKRTIIFKIFYWLIKIGAPLTLLLLPAVMLYGSFSTWEPAAAVLASYNSQTSIMIGFVKVSEHSWQAGKMYDPSYTERTYILFPSVIRHPKTISIRQYADNSVQANENKYGFVPLFIWYLLCLVATWFLWIRHPEKQRSHV